MDWTSVLSTIVAMAGGGGLGSLLTVLFKYRLDSRQQTHDHYLVLIAKLEARIEHLERAHENCTRENARLMTEVAALRETVGRLQSAVEPETSPTT